MKRLVKLPILFTFFISFALAGCGGSEKKPKIDKTPQGSIQNELGELKTRNFEPCDHQEFGRRLQVARALDKRKDEIAKFDTSRPKPNYNRVQVGEVTFLVPKEEPEPGKDEWVVSSLAWEHVFDVFDEIKDTPTDRNWIVLDRYVRGILVNDRNRINRKTNYYLGRKDKTAVKDLLDALIACLNQPDCTEAKLGSDAEQLYLTNPQYQKFHTPGNHTRRENLELFYKWVKVDYSDFYETRKFKTVNRVDQNTFEVKVFAGVYAGGGETLAKWFAEKWHSFGFQAQISWVAQNHPVSPFALLHSAITGGRAYVSFDDRDMTLYGEPKKEVFLHEMGHVLGLKDKYYTIWNPKDCKYHEEYNDGDIMSGNRNGQVTMESWDELNEMYPFI